jgi:hypothetical protein
MGQRGACAPGSALMALRNLETSRAACRRPKERESFKMIKNLVVMLVAGLGMSVGAAQTESASPARLQIPEPCPVVAKWLGQILSSGVNLRLVSYEPDLGILTYATLFSVSDPDPVLPSDVTDFNKSKDKTVNITGLILTLRSLVSSSLSFEDVPSQTATSCTISASLKFVSKKGRRLSSSGSAEGQLLEMLKKRYDEHGLDY